MRARQNLDRDPAIERLVPRLEDDPHSSAAQLAKQCEFTQAPGQTDVRARLLGAVFRASKPTESGRFTSSSIRIGNKARIPEASSG